MAWARRRRRSSRSNVEHTNPLPRLRGRAEVGGRKARSALLRPPTEPSPAQRGREIRMTRLNAAAWRSLVRSGHARAYERVGTTAGIVHLGAGAFFRAHGAVYN